MTRSFRFISFIQPNSTCPEHEFRAMYHCIREGWISAVLKVQFWLIPVVHKLIKTYSRIALVAAPSQFHNPRSKQRGMFIMSSNRLLRSGTYSLLPAHDGDEKGEEEELGPGPRLYWGRSFTFWISIFSGLFFCLSIWTFVMAAISVTQFGMTPMERTFT